MQTIIIFFFFFFFFFFQYESAHHFTIKFHELTLNCFFSQTVIRARSRANVSIAATDMRLEKLLRVPKERPVSAPVTNVEDRGARLSAGETENAPFSETIINGKKIRPQTTQGRLIASQNSDDEEL